MKAEWWPGNKARMCSHGISSPPHEQKLVGNTANAYHFSDKVSLVDATLNVQQRVLPGHRVSKVVDLGRETLQVWQGVPLQPVHHKLKGNINTDLCSLIPRHLWGLGMRLTYSVHVATTVCHTWACRTLLSLMKYSSTISLSLWPAGWWGAHTTTSNDVFSLSLVTKHEAELGLPKQQASSAFETWTVQQWHTADKVLLGWAQASPIPVTWSENDGRLSINYGGGWSCFTVPWDCA